MTEHAVTECWAVLCLDAYHAHGPSVLMRTFGDEQSAIEDARDCAAHTPGKTFIVVRTYHRHK